MVSSLLLGLVLVGAVVLFSVESQKGSKWVRAETASNSGINSQNLSLLEAGLASDNSFSSHGGGSINFLDDSVLVSDDGPGKDSSGEDLNLNTSDGQISVYVVREGDSLSQIARMFDVTVNTIIWANDMSHGDSIRPGQVLAILPVSGVRHAVESGDSLSSIAKKYQGNEEEIIQYNNLADGKVVAGEEIMVPYGSIPEPEKPAPSPTPKTDTGVAERGTGAVHAGYYLRPISGGVRTQGLHGYNAVDLASHHGAEIYASAGGVVSLSRTSGWNGGYGNYIVIDHPNGTQTLYSHLSRNAVHVGQSVSQGQVIGYMGSTGRSTGPHLHFEIRGGPTNPF